ncbi:hypothetical protein Bacsa_1477 [Phocaeicola salanitronis DSM 18170]|uniref:Lipoprotein n=1 Tax=Phocaeicola salanitronis (strain DSM 18170 / JCM 13657 / CCUG 60908 / BL78) TaxID=667015 RepID=F0QZ20_PHOSB|nr:fimbrillin family protein [Phocaeicola salanitronis]ADY36049.1 hypothetical protein Bacsa_1477 [Phocaeicola salanitronis DSM 18170]
MRLNQFVLPIAIGLALSACSEKDPVVQTQADSQPIALSASIDEGSQTSTRVTSGTIEEGTYYLSFANQNNPDELKSVQTLFENSIGYPWVYEEASGEGGNPQSYALNWNNVTTQGKSATFYLDNVNTETTSPTITLGEEYKASEYDAEANEKNDIVWDVVENVPYNTENISFTLTHRMSRVRVEIGYEGVEPPADPTYTVTLSGIKTTPADFNRTTGTVTPDDNSTDTITLLEEGVLTDEGYTPSWILPPQQVADNPELIVVVHEGNETTTYKGVLPDWMFPNSGDGKNEFVGEPVNLEFEAGKLLTIRVLLVEEVGKREILFLPAVVENWENIGELGQIISRQLGIYDADDWEEVVDAYNKNSSESNATLKRFGTYSGGKWTIYVFDYIGDADDTFTRFKNNNALNLNLSGYTVFGKTASNITDLFDEYTSSEDEETQTPTEGQEEQS